ncbi:MAG: S4 domain-containing protein [Salibacteraceae bacterium]
MRVDKFIWCTRLFKTRSLSSKACSEEKVKLNDECVKPSKEVNPGDRIALKVPPIWRTFEVKDVPKSRVGAKLVHDFMVETTSIDDLKALEMIQLVNKENRAAGIFGRPTKRNRRDLDDFKSG